MTPAIDPDVTLGDLVTEHPELARALERRGLDYCCGGARSLADACAEQGLDAGVVAAALGTDADAATVPDWAVLAPTALAEHIVATHHRSLDDELPRLSGLLEKIERVHGERHPELAAVRHAYESLRADLEPHLRKEERVLFPMIRLLESEPEPPRFVCGSLRNPISVMLAEHDLVGDLLRELRALTDGFTVPADGCASYRAAYEALEALEADTHLHVHKENNRLFPAVVALEDERCAAVGDG
ncbi:MAG: iron-sulfur cluster repair di-iron protein [Acidimicrobiia bacterium]|jgi:regulator of cell morphogenesis and NO signaling